MRKQLLTLLFCCVAAIANAQIERPKLVVSIIFDQMRWDYLTYYYDQFGEGGFKRVMSEGFNCENQMINYMPTITAIGHTSNYTGTTPSFHGIAGNSFYVDGKKVSCCEDHSVKTLGAKGTKGEASPHYMLATTIGDQLKIATDYKAKVFGVALKDRASILPAGHAADAAYWYDKPSGCFITSTYYMDKLPEWMKKYNKENAVPNKELMVSNDGVTATFNLAKAILQNEQLGKDDITDMLCISISSTDAVGHQFGTRGKENHDVYMTSDKELASFLNTLDEQVGKGNYLVVVTADHGGAHSPNLLKQHKTPAGGWDCEGTVKKVNEALSKQFGEGKYINDAMGFNLCINHELIAERNLDTQVVKDAAIKELRKDPEVQYAIDFEHAATSNVPQFLRERTLNGYFPGRNGDIMIITHPQVFSWRFGPEYLGTTHGAWNPYDAHIPLVFMGWGVGHGKTHQQTLIVDMAPTVCALLNIQMPNACTGTPIVPVMESLKK